MTARTWTAPATVVIPTELMADFEEWLDQRRLLLMGPARMSEDPEDLVWTVGPRREDFFGPHRASVFTIQGSGEQVQLVPLTEEQEIQILQFPAERHARLRAMGISAEQEREIRQRAAEQNRRAKAQEEQASLARQRDEDYQGD